MSCYHGTGPEFNSRTVKVYSSFQPFWIDKISTKLVSELNAESFHIMLTTCCIHQGPWVKKIELGTVAPQSLVLVYIYSGVRKAKLKKGEENVCFTHNLEILSFLNRGGGGRRNWKFQERDRNLDDWYLLLLQRKQNSRFF